MKRVLSKCYVSQYDGIKVTFTWTSPIIKNEAFGLKAFLYVWLDFFCFWDRFCTQTQMKELCLFWGRLFHITWRELTELPLPTDYVRVERHYWEWWTKILAFDKWVLAGGVSVVTICGCGSTELNECELVALLSQCLPTLPSDGRFLTLVLLTVIGGSPADLHWPPNAHRLDLIVPTSQTRTSWTQCADWMIYACLSNSH